MIGCRLSRSPEVYQALRDAHRVREAVSTRKTPARNSEGRTVVGTCANKRQTKRHVNRFIEIHDFQGGESLIVI
jgi:hypothetical protein